MKRAVSRSPDGIVSHNAPVAPTFMRAFTVMRGTMTLCERLPDKEENAMVATPKIATRHPATKMSNSLYTPEEYFERDECSEERLEYVN